MANLNESIYGWNVEEGFEVVRTKSWAVRGKWFVSIRDKETWKWHHSESVYSKAEAKKLFDRYAAMSNEELGGVLSANLTGALEERVGV
jgi:hypothetical protein